MFFRDSIHDLIFGPEGWLEYLECLTQENFHPLGRSNLSPVSE